ncbi:MAG: ABC transporter permease [Pleomorphochaeta sp.]
MENKIKKRSEKSFISYFKKSWKESSTFSTAVALFVMIILQTLALGFDFSDGFGFWLLRWGRNWINILRNNSNIGIISLGMTFVIISGGIDLAVGSALVAIGAFLMVFINVSGGVLSSIGIVGVPAYIIAIILSLLVGFLLGSFTGVIITYGKLPPFIATLGTMKIFRSVTQQFMQGNNPQVPKPFLQIASVEVFNLMIMPIIYWIIIAYILNLVSKRTAFGKHVYAVGSNERAAALSGINVKKVKLFVYALMGFLVAIAAVLQVSRIGAMDYANAGAGYEMDAISAVIVGGTSMSGGRGTIGGTILGVLIISVMNNLLNLLGVPPFLREAFKGVIVICAVLLQKKEED